MQLLRVFFLLLSAKKICTALSNYPVLLIISFDGFRYDYFNKGNTPTLDALRRSSTRAYYLKNVFPTKTFPNHHSIATGLYPESHGVLGNYVYDTKEKKEYNYSAELYSTPNVIPIWTLNQIASKRRHSGIMMWPGGEFKYKGVKPTFYQTLEPSVPWKTRIDIVIEWLTHKETPANLVMMYFNQPDKTSHDYGLDSPDVITRIKELDDITEYLRHQLYMESILDKINVVQLSDHGMENVTLEKVINVKHLINAKNYELVDTSPVLQIFRKTRTGSVTDLYGRLKEASFSSHFQVYKKSEIPDEWHYNGSARSPPILLVANEGYVFDDMTSYIKKSKNGVVGVHGYNTSNKNMRPFFFAWGPKVKKNKIVGPFNTVDLYSLFSKILGLQKNQPKTNGTLPENIVN